jgi:hypothetical protein
MTFSTAHLVKVSLLCSYSCNTLLKVHKYNNDPDTLHDRLGHSNFSNSKGDQLNIVYIYNNS